MLSDDVNRVASENQVIVVLLLSLLITIVGLGLLLTGLAVRWRWSQGWPLHRRRNRGLPRLARAGGVSTGSTTATNCTRPRTWLAIRHTNLSTVQRILSLNDPRPCPWTESLNSEVAGRLYVSPPVAGWVLVTGAELPEPADDIDACFRFLANLSRQLGHVQYFHRNRVSQHHAWAKLESGRVLRAYAWVGYTAWDQGPPAVAERELGLRVYGYAEGLPAADAELPEDLFANVERLPQLAARWSIDPAAVDTRFWSSHPGISGEFSVPHPL